MSNSNDLLPCPFCGGEPTESSRYFSSGGDSCKVFLVKCENNECRIKPKADACGPWGYNRDGKWLENMGTNDLAQADARARWNKRT